MNAITAALYYSKVIVYCVHGNCRNNLGNWKVRTVMPRSKRRDFGYYAAKDVAMVDEASSAVMVWDGNSRGTINNVVNAVELGKEAEVYIVPAKAFVFVQSKEDIPKLLDHCTDDERVRLLQHLPILSDLMSERQLRLA